MAIKTVKFESMRGNFRFSNDHFPIQDYYLGEVTADADGKPEIALRNVILKAYGNAYQAECRMK